MVDFMTRDGDMGWVIVRMKDLDRVYGFDLDGGGIRWSSIRG
jgi:hypothetical protein